MVNVKFKKLNNAAFMSHIEMQNAINRTIKRAGYEPKYSAGYNPHALLKLSSPLPLGINSIAEYLTLGIDLKDAKDFLERLNASAPKGLIFDKLWLTENNPNFAGRITAADYEITLSDADAARAFDFSVIKDGFTVSAKDGAEKDMKDYIFSFEKTGGLLKVKLAAGNTVLRADRFIETLNKYYHSDICAYDILKVRAYFKGNDGFLDIDDSLGGADEICK